MSFIHWCLQDYETTSCTYASYINIGIQDSLNCLLNSCNCVKIANRGGGEQTGSTPVSCCKFGIYTHPVNMTPAPAPDHLLSDLTGAVYFVTYE